MFIHTVEVPKKQKSNLHMIVWKDCLVAIFCDCPVVIFYEWIAFVGWTVLPQSFGSSEREPWPGQSPMPACSGELQWLVSLPGDPLPMPATSLTLSVHIALSVPDTNR